MWNRKINISMAVIFVLSPIGSLVDAGVVETSAVNSPADLDLSGNIVYAVNFGNNGNPRFGDFVFSQDQDHPNISLDISAEGVISNWGGVYPNTGYPDLDMLLGGIIWKNSSSTGRTTSITIAGGLTVGRSYLLQLIFYTDHDRPMDIIIEGQTVVERYDPFPIQGSVTGKGGSVVRCVFTTSDTTLNVAMKSNPDIDASAISGFILTDIGPVPFTDYGSGTTIELVSGKGTWQISWGQGPWAWSSESTAQPLLDPNVSGILDIHTTAPANVSADLVATLPIEGTLTLSAQEKSNNVVIGTMMLRGTGVNIVDLNVARAVVDEGSGIGMAPFHAPGPEMTMSLEEATGVFAYIKQSGNWRLQLAGLYALPLTKNPISQAHILAALGGKVPLIGGLGTFALSGQYVPDMSKKVKSFCEYGKGVASQLGAGGAIWDQTWGHGPYDWYDCDADPDAGILGKDVVGVLETTTAGAPQIDEGLILRFDFGGNFALTDYTDTNHEVIAGQILGDVKGTFVADVNAANAVVDEAAGTITIVFGAVVNDAPDALITVTETTGTFENIRAVGVWEWHVSGTIACARVPTLSVQDNILAALGNSDLLLGAEEEIVLSGSYYLSSSEE